MSEVVSFLYASFSFSITWLVKALGILGHEALATFLEKFVLTSSAKSAANFLFSYHEPTVGHVISSTVFPGESQLR